MEKGDEKMNDARARWLTAHCEGMEPEPHPETCLGTAFNAGYREGFARGVVSATMKETKSPTGEEQQ